MTDRAAFEAWASSIEVQLSMIRHKEIPSTYDSALTAWAWSGWQEAVRLERDKCAAILEEECAEFKAATQTAIAHEREACAKLCEGYEMDGAWSPILDVCAASIRARSSEVIPTPQLNAG